MKALKFLAVAACALSVALLSSCGGSSSNEDKVSVADTNISGPLSPYFKLVDKKYLYQKSIIDEVTVDLECVEALPSGKNGHLAVVALDGDDITLGAGEPDSWSFNDYSLLSNAKPGDIVTVTINNHNNVKDGKKVSKIRLISDIEDDSNSSSYSYSSSYSSSYDDDDDDDSPSYSSSSSSTSSADVDEMLDSYESYVDQYIKFAKKAADGDMDAMMEYSSLLSKAQDFADKIEACKGEMTSAQLSRYTRITTKMATAAM